MCLAGTGRCRHLTLRRGRREAGADSDCRTKPRPAPHEGQKYPFTRNRSCRGIGHVVCWPKLGLEKTRDARLPSLVCCSVFRNSTAHLQPARASAEEGLRYSEEQPLLVRQPIRARHVEVDIAPTLRQDHLNLRRIRKPGHEREIARDLDVDLRNVVRPGRSQHLRPVIGAQSTSQIDVVIRILPDRGGKDGRPGRLKALGLRIGVIEVQHPPIRQTAICAQHPPVESTEEARAIRPQKSPFAGGVHQRVNRDRVGGRRHGPAFRRCRRCPANRSDRFEVLCT